jgi:hypothetical protein
MTDVSDVARRRRLAEVWRASAPSRDEIVQLRARLERRSRRPRASRGKVMIVALVQGAFFGVATLAAAAWIAEKTLPHSSIATVASSSSPAPARAPRGSTRMGTVAEPPPALTANTAIAAFDDVATEARSFGKGDTVRASAGGKARTNGVQALIGRPPTARPMASEMPPAAPASSAPTPASDGPWVRVAEALSERDWTAADRALNELSANGDPATRDAADLARAELLIARGEAGSLRPLVERLARSGATGLVRTRAAALLERLPSR